MPSIFHSTISRQRESRSLATTILFLAGIAVVAPSTSGLGQGTRAARSPSPEGTAIARINGAIRLDGKSDEAAWSAVEPVEPTVLAPTFEAAPSHRTEFRFAHDSFFFYAAARMYVNDPHDIRGNSLQRDRLGNDDVFRIVLDTYNDGETGVCFATTPTGLRADCSVSGDGQSVNYDFNTAWEAAAVRTDSGWFAEMRIPLSSLRFSTSDGVARMGLIAVRNSAALNEVAVYPSISPRFSNPSFRVSLAKKISIDGAVPQRDLRILPFALGGASRVATLGTGAGGYGLRESITREVGGDLKYGVTSNTNIDLSLNTDFAQVEVDDQQINLTRFSLFFPEKRQFFLERQGVFDFNTGGIGDASRVFNSRQIGLTAEGTPVRILGGVRGVARLGGWDLAALNMQTERAGVTPAENFGVLRIRRQVLRPGSTVGGILTNRMSTGGKFNRVLGADALLRIGVNDFLSTQVAQVYDDESVASLASGMVRMSLERRASQGLVYRVGAKWSGRDHDPELGFQARRDFTHLETNVRYGWYPGVRTVFQNIQPSLAAYTYLRNADGAVETAQMSGFLNFALKQGTSGFLVHSRSSELLLRSLPLAPSVGVPAGRHNFYSTSINVNTPQGARVRAFLSVGRGRFYDGNQTTASVSPALIVSKNVELSAEYQVNRVNFTSRSERLAADLARLRIQTALNTRLSASGFVQYNRLSDRLVTNARIRVHMNEGRDLFVVYNEQLNTDRPDIAPRLPFSQERSLLIKWVYAFTP